MGFRIAERRWTTDDTVEVISRYDPALDFGKCDFDKYDADFEREHLSIKQGESPCVFVCRPLDDTERESTRLTGLAVGEDKAGGGDLSIKVYLNAWKRAAFLRGVLCVKNVEVQKGGVWALQEITPDLAAARFDPHVVHEIGDVVIGISRAPVPDEAPGQDVGKSCLPDTSKPSDSSGD